MGKTMEKLWADYMEGECSAMDTEEELALARMAAKKRKVLDDLMEERQRNAVEAYVEAVCELNAFFAKKAFVNGCRLAASFLLEAIEVRRE